jgi:hypothetical protein
MKLVQHQATSNDNDCQQVVQEQEWALEVLQLE